MNLKLIEHIRTNAPILYIELDSKGYIDMVNEFTTQLVGKNPSGLHYREVIIDFTESIDIQALSQKPENSHRISISNSSNLPIDFQCAFLFMNDRYLIIGSTDYQEFAIVQKEILNLNQQLSNTTRELHKSNAELSRLNKMKNEFLGMATHDLRSPLGLIMTFSEFLIDETGENLSEEHNYYLQKIHSSCYYMRQIVDDYLDVTKIESGNIDLNIQFTNIPKIIEQVISVAEIQAKKKSIELIVKQDADIPQIELDPEKIEQVLRNIITNAVDHSNEHSSVFLRTKLVDNSIHIEIEDHGVGIPNKDLPILFNPFERKTSRKTGGEKSTGLGLVIARKIIDAHKGEIKIESKEGEGTTIKILLPITNKE
ncbi:MAG: HAMP domain-containing sensor histidine kinase [Spirochaetia bacterium]|nr:HAMP domain-containing sensor histidine kinase [Spirochaetia bacterium]